MGRGVGVVGRSAAHVGRKMDGVGWEGSAWHKCERCAPEWAPCNSVSVSGLNAGAQKHVGAHGVRAIAEVLQVLTSRCFSSGMLRMQMSTGSACCCCCGCCGGRCEDCAAACCCAGALACPAGVCLSDTGVSPAR